jgi:hypothetical protein
MNDVLRPLSAQSDQKSGLSLAIFFLFLILVLLAGTTFGSYIGGLKSKKTTGLKLTNQKKEGVADKKTFRDQAEGILREGGIDGEGNFHLERPGGKSQNVYLFSTVVDLSKYMGKKVRVWGETFAGKKAGWLMDVGLIEVIE